MGMQGLCRALPDSMGTHEGTSICAFTTVNSSAPNEEKNVTKRDLNILVNKDEIEADDNQQGSLTIRSIKLIEFIDTDFF